MFIERLAGIILASFPTGIVIDVNGVGYGLEMPLSGICQMPRAGEQVAVWVHTLVKEDAIRLFGFVHFEDKQAFQILLSLNGVGPKVALAILSTLTVSALEKAVLENQSRIIETVPGVGPRLAEKIIVELKPKISKLKSAHLVDIHHDRSRYGIDRFDSELGLNKQSDEEDVFIYEDLISALENLGYKEKIVNPIVEKLRKDHGTSLDLQELMRRALKMLTIGLIEGSRGGGSKSINHLGIDEKNFF